MIKRMIYYIIQPLNIFSTKFRMFYRQRPSFHGFHQHEELWKDPSVPCQRTVKIVHVFSSIDYKEKYRKGLLIKMTRVHVYNPKYTEQR